MFRKSASKPRGERVRPSLMARLRNYFLTGLVVVGPITVTIWITWWFVDLVDGWVKPLVPAVYDPGTYLPYEVPGFGLLFAVVMLTMIGALAANLLGKALITSGEAFLGSMPIVRNLYRGTKQIFESVKLASEASLVSGDGQGPHRVGLIEFPRAGIWSIVYVTGEAAGAIRDAEPGGEADLVAVFMPTGMVPPAGFVCFVPRREVIFLPISMEDAAKTVVSAGMFMPEQQEHIKALIREAQERLKQPLPPGE